MQIMKSYVDMCNEIDLIKDQIELTKKELNYWFGIDLNNNKGVPMDSVGSQKFGVTSSLIQAEKKMTNYQRLTKRLTELERDKYRIDDKMQRFEGLDYKIAYRRIVEGMTHQEIADDLGYEEQTIRKRWSTLRQQTDLSKRDMLIT